MSIRASGWASRSFIIGTGWSARHYPGLGAVPCEQLDRLLEAGGPLVLECSRNLHRALLGRCARCCIDAALFHTGPAMGV